MMSGMQIAMEPAKVETAPFELEPIELNIRWQCAALILDEYFQTT